jgi:hypothetical protein
MLTVGKDAGGVEGLLLAGRLGVSGVWGAAGGVGAWPAAGAAGGRGYRVAAGAAAGQVWWARVHSCVIAGQRAGAASGRGRG